MAKKKAKAFPPIIYVHYDGEAGDEYLSTHETPDSAIDCAGDGGKVATYRLDVVREAVVTRALVKK